MDVELYKKYNHMFNQVYFYGYYYYNYNNNNEIEYFIIY